MVQAKSQLIQNGFHLFFRCWDYKFPCMKSFHWMVLMCLVSFAQGSVASDWPTYRHDGNRSAVSSESMPGQLNPQWIFESRHQPMSAWPMPGEETPRMHTDRAYHVVVAGRTLFFGNNIDNHIAPEPGVMKIIKTVMPGEGANISYTHRPLPEQLDILGMRKLELDVFHDIKGGAFATPLGATMTGLKNWKSRHPEFDTLSMMSPGMKIIHFPNFDFRSNTPTLKTALSELNIWSKKNNLHLPIMILIETKKTTAVRKGNKSGIFEMDDFRQLEKEIVEILKPEQIITPNKVQGGHKTLNQAIRKGAWPSLGECRGKFVLALDNQGAERINYLKLHPGLQGALLFVSSPPGQPESAFLKINDPKGNYLEIQKRIKEGYLIRTRADSDLREGRTNDYRQMNLAFSSGAQYISTDFPEKMEGYSDYSVQWPNGKVGRLNPLFEFDQRQVTMEPEKLSSQIISRRFALKVPAEVLN